LILFVFVKVGVKLVVAGNVQGDAKRVICFPPHFSQIESGYGDGVVDNDLVVVPPRMTAQTTIKTLNEALVCIAFPSFLFRDQQARPSQDDANGRTPPPTRERAGR
jgi:hypothetical protein